PQALRFRIPGASTIHLEIEAAYYYFLAIAAVTAMSLAILQPAFAALSWMVDRRGWSLTPGPIWLSRYALALGWVFAGAWSLTLGLTKQPFSFAQCVRMAITSTGAGFIGAIGWLAFFGLNDPYAIFPWIQQLTRFPLIHDPTIRLASS